VLVTFDKPPGNTIGDIEKDPQSGTATVFATVPLAEFGTYWTILHHERPSYIQCGIDVGATTVGYISLATEGCDAPFS
jgi:hypothetical protein